MNIFDCTFFVFLLIVTSYSYVIPLADLRRHINAKLPHPVIFVPGNGGSQAYAQFRDYDSPPFQIWVDLRYLVSPRTFGDYFKLIYNNETRRTEDNDKAIISFPGWGETWPIDNLDSRFHSVTKYFYDLTTAFMQNPYYVANFTIRGAPFDFRKAPNENADFVDKMRALVEETYSNGGNRPVVLVAHSMGSLYSLAFLRAQSDAWKRKHIKAFICTSAPLGGSMKALKIEASGDNFGIYFDNPLWYREAQRSMPSLAFLLPDPRLWSPEEVVIYTPTKNYTVHDYEAFFNDIGFPEGYQMYLDTKASVDGLVAPTGVDEVHCIYSTLVHTPASLIYPETFPDAAPTIVYEPDGDGTVNARSLHVCETHWRGVAVQSMAVPNVNHLAIVLDPRFIDRVKAVANADQLPPPKQSFWYSLLININRD